jgi:hypothetical protein
MFEVSFPITWEEVNKGAKKERKKKVTPEFDGYLKRNFIPPYPQIQGVTNLTPLTGISPPRFKKKLARKQGWFIGCSWLS